MALQFNSKSNITINYYSKSSSSSSSSGTVLFEDILQAACQFVFHDRYWVSCVYFCVSYQCMNAAHIVDKNKMHQSTIGVPAVSGGGGAHGDQRGNPCS